MVVTLDSEKCMGCGVCVQIAPDVFSLDADRGVAKVVCADGSSMAKQASDSCPVSCIEITD